MTSNSISMFSCRGPQTWDIILHLQLASSDKIAWGKHKHDYLPPNGGLMKQDSTQNKVRYWSPTTFPISWLPKKLQLMFTKWLNHKKRPNSQREQLKTKRFQYTAPLLFILVGSDCLSHVWILCNVLVFIHNIIKSTFLFSEDIWLIHDWLNS